MAATRIVNVQLGLSSPLSLDEALAVAEGLSHKDIVGYRFENDGVVGEYFPRGEDPGEFLDEFRADFGMAPTIVGLIEAIRTTSDPLSRTEAFAPEVIEVTPSSNARELSTSSREGRVWAELAEGRASAETRGLVIARPTIDQPTESEAAAARSVQSADVTLSWEPTFARFALRNRANGTKANIYQEYIWSEPGYDPLFRDLKTALEFEINQHNASWILGNDSEPYRRPNCIQNVKEHFWATNSGYTWGVASPYGFASAGIGAYADTNDLSDWCSHQSMAIGVSNPGNVNDDGYGFKQLARWIDANRGAVATDSHVSGVVQAVEKLSCNAWPWNGNVVNTDCVGLDQAYTYNGDGPSFVTTLNRSRNVWAPTRCWLRSRTAQVWEPGQPASQVYFGSCDYMFDPLN